MDYRKSDAPVNTQTRNILDFCKGTDNIYESVVIMSNLDEVFENREQIEISRYYERLPKPALIAEQEFLDDKLYYRNPLNDKEGIV